MQVWFSSLLRCHIAYAWSPKADSSTVCSPPCQRSNLKLSGSTVMQELLLREHEENSLLRDITGVQRLEDVTFLDAVVDCNETSLSNLGEKMPLLRELKLNNSALQSIRDLGSKLKHLQILWVSHCGLTGLEGLNALPSLKELYAAFNKIDNLEPIADMETLEILDLEGNEVDDLGSLAYLKWCPQLAVVTFTDNPIAAEPNYQAEVLEALPQLQTLDDSRLSRPLSPLSKIAAAHRHATNRHATAAFHSHAASHNLHSMAQPQNSLASNSLYSQPLSAAASTGTHLGRYIQRPASAGGMLQRLPPVASGRNQPGSYMLHNLTLVLTPDPVLSILQGPLAGSAGFMDSQPLLSRREDLIAQLCSEVNDQDKFTAAVDALSQHSSTAQQTGRLARPASAGFRRPGTAQEEPEAEANRPSSAGSEVGTSPEAAGLFWRKHRLLEPQGFKLVLQDQLGALESSSPASNQADTDVEVLFSRQDSITAAAAVNDTNQAQDAVPTERSTRQCDQHPGSAMQSGVLHDTMQSQDDLPAGFDAAMTQQPEVVFHASQLCSADRTSTEVQAETSLRQIERLHAHTMAAQQSGTEAADGRFIHIRQSLKPEAGLQHFDAHQLGSKGSKHCQHDSTDSDKADSRSCVVNGQSFVDSQLAGSSFLQRLAKAKQPLPTSAHPYATSAANDRPPTPERPVTPFSHPARRRNFVAMSDEEAVLSNGESSVDTHTSVSRTSVIHQWELQRPRASGFVSNNIKFAPMQDMDSAYMASISAKLAMRPASASAAQVSASTGSALAWTGSMQLPPGVLLGAAQQQHMLSKAKKRYNWGFDNPNGI